MQGKDIVVCFGIGCMTIFGLACVFKGIDSAVVAAVSSTICTVVGYYFGIRAKGEKE